MSPLWRFLFSLGMVLAVFAAGTLGYVVVEGWSPFLSFYMTVITVATVGFREVGQLSPRGMLFTIFLIIFGVGAVGYAVSSLTALIIEGEIRDIFKGRRMETAIAKLVNHYIICGGGVVGREVALEFQRAKVPFVVVERDLAGCEIDRDSGVLIIEGDASEDETLRRAGIERARGLVSALRQDADNVFITLTARQLNPGLLIISRASESGTEAKLLRAGANRVVSPYQIGGRRMAFAALRPTVVNFLDVVTGFGESALRVEDIPVRSGSPLVGKQIREADIGQKTGTIVLGIQNAGGLCHLTTPDATLATTVIQAEDPLIVLGNESQIGKLRQILQG